MKPGWTLWMAGLLLVGPATAAEKPASPKARPAASGPSKETQAAQLIQRTDELEATGKLSEAAPLLRQAAELTPDDWALWDRAGWMYVDLGQAAAAVPAFEAARKAAPPGTPLLGGLLVSHFLLGHQKEVQDLLKELVPTERLEKTTEIVTKGLAAQPKSAERDFALGHLYARVLGGSGRGLQPLEAVVQANPKHAEAWLLLVEVNRTLNRGRQEDAAAVKYLELAPESVDAYRLRAERYGALRQQREAVAEYDAGIKKHLAAAELYFGLARTHERLGNAKQAEATYRRLVTEAEKGKQEALKGQARAQLANFQARQRNYLEAEKYYREAGARPDAAAATVRTWAALLMLTAKWEEAAKALEGVAAREEKERGKTLPAAREELLETRYRAAVCRLAAGQKDAAKTALEAALGLKNEVRTSPQAEAEAFLAWLEGKSAGKERLAYDPGDERWGGFTWRSKPEQGELEVRGRFSPSATAWRAALQHLQKTAPGCWPAEYALARSYAAAGLTDEALRLLGRVTQARADWWAPHYAMGQYYTRERQKDRAVPILRKTLQLAPECRQARAYLSLLSNLKEEDEE